MRKFVFIALAALAVLACKKEKLVQPEASITGEVSNITQYSATVTCYSNTTGLMRRIQRGVAYSTDPEMAEANSDRVFLAEGEGAGKYSIELTGLEPSTTYYYRSCLAHESISGSSGAIYDYGEIKSFETLPYDGFILEESHTAGVTSALLRAKLDLGKVMASDVYKAWFEYSRYRRDVASGHCANFGAEVDENGTISGLLSELDQYWEECFYRAAILTKGNTYHYGMVQSFRPRSFTATEGTVIDMGLSVKWAPTNVGSSTPEDYGDFFAWGETSSKEDFSEAMYNYSENPEVLPLSADAARYKMGGAWRMPTMAEFKELIDNSLVEWGSYKGFRPGCLCISIKNDNAVFFPASGFKQGMDHMQCDDSGLYWTSTGNPNGSEPYSFVFLTSPHTIKFPNDRVRYIGGNVRAVCE